MAYENVSQGGIPGVTASADLSAKQFFFAIIDGEGTVGLAGNGAAADGVIVNKPISGQSVSLAIPGDTVKVSAGAAVAAGANVASDANGQGVTAATTEYILGKCINAVSNADELMTVQLTTPGRLA